MAYDLIAAVDLGSNSFRLQVGRIVGNQIYPLDSLKDPVRLAAGLKDDKQLDAASQTRGLEAIARYGERLRGFAPGAVRAVATNTLRVAKNATQFLLRAEEALGFPIEVIAGREEARLIYLGVAHSLPNPRRQSLVVDIGGGSTEFIIGSSFQPTQLESLYMGCVSYTLRFFPEGNVDKRQMKEAELAARRELQSIGQTYRDTGWEQAVGSSGSAKAICDLLELNGFSESGITCEGLDHLRSLLLVAGNAGNLTLEGMRPDRIPVLAGGIAIMSAVFREFELEHMAFSDGALRLGVLYDLLGRYHHEDLREATVEQFMQRYGIDRRQAARVAQTAAALLEQMLPVDATQDDPDSQVLLWASCLHEIGISVAHTSYHKHSAYILANADMPGFSRRDQARLSRLVLGHRGKLERLQDVMQETEEWLLVFCLRIAALLHRSRNDDQQPVVEASRSGRGFQLVFDAGWLDESPLTAAALTEEQQQWEALGISLRIKERAAASAAKTRSN
ncbi:Exopolyphosphatase [Georgfuchsia toluolica]|uniref:Exopolyphosphatase n=1 Tax=Georgfuchsia toluolica TaxID=424218 RepID=A0A916N8K8_9PROT|nr:exopolyphosphatase [Georgfuchsia toluolica]CAG4882711.1 Exopolyphosphatase [Georgfuchsia toluolica]